MIRKSLGYVLLATPFLAVAALGVVQFGWVGTLLHVALGVTLAGLLLILILAALWLIDGGRR